MLEAPDWQFERQSGLVGDSFEYHRSFRSHTSGFPIRIQNYERWGGFMQDQALSSFSTDLELQNRTRRKIFRRIVPFLFVLYIIAYLDRANVAFAKLPMSFDLG